MALPVVKRLFQAAIDSERPFNADPPSARGPWDDPPLPCPYHHDVLDDLLEELEEIAARYTDLV